jgi:hypothetical protein
MTIKRKPPLWHRLEHERDMLKGCCHCGKPYGEVYQIGDGKRIHSLCGVCYHKLKIEKKKEGKSAMLSTEKCQINVQHDTADPISKKRDVNEKH